MNKGKFVLIVGGVAYGKSTFVKGMEEINKGHKSIDFFIEPKSTQSGGYECKGNPSLNTALMFMQLIMDRLKMYDKALDAYNKGKTIVLDTPYDFFYDLLQKDYPFADGDLLLQETIALAKAATAMMPEIDMIIFLDIDKEQWLENVNGRGRGAEVNSPRFLDSFESSRQLYLDAASEYADRHGIPLLTFKNKDGLRHLTAIANEAYTNISWLMRGFAPFHSQTALAKWLIEEKEWTLEDGVLRSPVGVHLADIRLNEFDLDKVNKRLAQRYLSK